MLNWGGDITWLIVHLKSIPFRQTGKPMMIQSVESVLIDLCSRNLEVGTHIRLGGDRFPE